MSREFKVYPAYTAERFSIMAHDTEAPNAEGALALHLIERWALIMTDEDGEDSSGRQKFKVMPVNDIVARACECAEVSMQALRERGWMLKVPTIVECEALANKEEREPA